MGLAGFQLASLVTSRMPEASLGIGHFRMLGARRNLGTSCRDREGQLQGYIVSGSRIQKNLVVCVVGSLRAMTHLYGAAL